MHQGVQRAPTPAKHVKVMGVKYATETTPPTTRGRAYRPPPGTRAVSPMESNVGTLHRPRRGVDARLILLKEKHQAEYGAHYFDGQLPVSTIQLLGVGGVLVERDHMVGRIPPRRTRTGRLCV
jgi:hypothetical protein